MDRIRSTNPKCLKGRVIQLFYCRQPFYLVVTLGKELDGRESLDLDVFEFVACRVHLGDNNILRVLEFLTELIPDWDELLAVACV